MRACVAGSGPNGLTAALVLAEAGLQVTVLEAQPTPGGGARTAELTLPGFLHDTCSAAHPMGIASPGFGWLELEQHGLTWLNHHAPLAHPLDGGRAVLVQRAISATAGCLGADAEAWMRLMEPLVVQWKSLILDLLRPPHWPGSPELYARFGLQALRPAREFAMSRFRGVEARALFAGLAAHAGVPLEFAGSSSFGLVLGAAAHAVGWPLARGGSGQITGALLRRLSAAGAELHCGEPLRDIRDAGADGPVLLDLAPGQAAEVAGARLTEALSGKLRRFRHGPGAFKLDYALDGPVPWSAPDCLRAATVHLGGTLEEIAASERDAWEGRTCERPFVIVAQSSLFDPSRAPEGRHTLWAYCHVPNGSTEDMTDRIERQIERFAPGFTSRILHRAARRPGDLESSNANLVGGDVGGGANNLAQIFARPFLSRTPYRLSSPGPDGSGIYLCSASTPPGGGVHGMCGYWAAHAALGDLRSSR